MDPIRPQSSPYSADSGRTARPQTPRPARPAGGTMQRTRIHPLIATAAGAVTVACCVAVAAITGFLPHAGGTPAPSAAMSSDTTAPYAAAGPGTTPAAGATMTTNPAGPSTTLASNGGPGTAAASALPPAPPLACHSCGTVSSIQTYRVEGRGTGIGAVGGAVAGGLVGQAFGGGHGRIATTLLGAAGGGFAGNAIEKHVRSTTEYRVNVHMADGVYRSFRYGSAPPFSDGERVHIANGVLRAG